MELVKMTHPEIPGAEPAVTTDDAFRKVWEPRGWQLADQAALDAAGVLGEPVEDLAGLNKAQLLEVAANLGIEGLNQRTAKDDIVAAIQDTYEYEEE